MEQTETREVRPRDEPPHLVRPKEGRFIAGVAKGLADRLAIPIWVVRGAFVALTLLGGLGLALYGAGWLLIRSEDEPQSVASQLFSDPTSARSWIGIALIFLAALVLLDNFTFFDGGVLLAVGLLVAGILLYTGKISGDGPDGGTGPDPGQGSPEEAAALVDEAAESPETSAGEGAPGTPEVEVEGRPAPPPRERSMLGRLTVGVMLVAAGILAVLDNIPALPIDARPRHYLALAVTVLGLGLVVGAFVGRARWLILIGVLLLPALLLSPVLEYDWSSDQFEILVAPDGFEELDDGYIVDVGNLVIDLTDLPWDGETVDLVTRADAGKIEIYLPEEVGLIGEATVGVGWVAAPGRTSAGLGEPKLEFDEEGTVGLVLLDASVDVGGIDVVRSP